MHESTQDFRWPKKIKTAPSPRASGLHGKRGRLASGWGGGVEDGEGDAAAGGGEGLGSGRRADDGEGGFLAWRGGATPSTEYMPAWRFVFGAQR